MLGQIEIHGHCDHRFSSVKEAFADNFRTRGDVGASFAATIDGRFVIDIWAGYADAGLTHPWEHDTLAVSIHDKDDDGSVRVDTGRPRRLCRKGDQRFLGQVHCRWGRRIHVRLAQG